MPENQQPVDDDVHEVGRDQHHHDRPHPVGGLQVAAQRRIEQERERAPGDDAEVGRGHAEHRRVQTPRGHEVHEFPRDRHHRRRRDHREPEAVAQPAMALVAGARPVGLRHKGIEPEQQTHPENRERDEHRATEADSADRLRRHASDHDGVDHAHHHPAELGDHDRPRQREHGSELVTQVMNDGAHAKRSRIHDGRPAPGGGRE